MTDSQKLEPYLGRDVTAATLEIRGTGSGLDKSMAFPPIALPPGETVDVVLRCVVDKHRHDLDDDDGTFTLVNICRAETATLVEDGAISVERAIATAQERVAERRAAEEEAKRRANGEVTLFEGDASEERVGLARPDLDAAEQAIRQRASGSSTLDESAETGNDALTDDQVYALAVIVAATDTAARAAKAGDRTDTDARTVAREDAEALHELGLVALGSAGYYAVQVTRDVLEAHQAPSASDVAGWPGTDEDEQPGAVEVLTDLEQLDPDKLTDLVAQLTPARREGLRIVGAANHGWVPVSNRTDPDKPSIYWQTADWLVSKTLLRSRGGAGSSEVQVTPEGRQVLAHLAAEDLRGQQRDEDSPF